MRAAAAAVAAADAPAATIGQGPLLWLTVGAIVVIILLIAWAKLHPLIALILGSAVLGLGSGMGAEATISAFVDGLGGTIGDIGLLIALGAMLGRLLDASAAAERLVDRFVRVVPDRAIPWAMAGIAFLIGLPLFFEVALVLVFPMIVLVVRRSGLPLLKVAIPALAALSLLNGFLPPHPGPLLAVSAFHADLGRTLLFGLIVAVPTVIIGGPLLGSLLARVVPATPIDAGGDAVPRKPSARVPGTATTLATMLLPVLLMLFRAIAELTLPEGSAVRGVAETIGEPTVALLAGCLLAMVTFGLATGIGRREVGSVMGTGLPLVAGIILIVGAGGGFKSTLVATGVGDTIAGLTDQLGLPPLVLGWLLAAVIRIAVGSGTVAIVTAAGLLSPLAATMGAGQVALLALAVGAGSRFGSHVNDAGFWMVKEFLGLSVKDTFRTWTVMDCVVSLVAGLGVVALGAVVG
ncbi:GntT/GntP/DsdX family permease [Amycolatopsis jiangsuensis]|uniref:GntP family gluconate:H+ symporter n=1 Tax=Amycolatopsis jiangsuensis TaxID=1181879 RepID=A0A840IZ59_9PSEU|nr:gluconate:H+ symporter [Amycolatopsis jiangsuensis]MBB4686799.1 GntP family gluconate:H+ symporter [Amycolatopsis jiangsuensis]